MTASIVNAAPMVIDRGTQDLSKKPVTRDPIAVPQHLPKCYFFAQKGTTDETLAVGVDLTNIYGDATFDPLSKYFNHATMYALGANAQGNSIMAKRVIPEDAGPKSTVIAWLDVLPTTVDLYQRNSDGSIKIDSATGDPIISGTAAGYKVKWVVTHYQDEAAALAGFGALTIEPGTQTDSVTHTQSQRYPMFEMEVSSIGEDGNNCGIRLSAPTTASTQMPTKMMTTEYAYPYFVQMVHRASSISSPSVVNSIYNEQSVMFTFKPEVIDPLTTTQLYAGDIIIPSYESLTDPRYAKIYGPFHRMHVYDANIDLLVGLFHAAETPYIDSFSDFTADATQKHLFNFLTGVSSANVPYHSFIFVDEIDTTRWSESTNVYAAGGSDGTMTDATFAALVATEAARYADPMDPLQEMAVNVESVLYDSGYPLATKYELIKFISQRRDTAVVLSPYDVNDRTLTAAEEDSIAIALRTRAQMYPESDYFGTGVMRAIIIGRSAKVRNSQFKKRLPMTYELLIKAAKYMGAGNGRWTNGESFAGAPGSIVTEMTDISITWVPASVRNRNWDVGLNWVQAYDTVSYFFPAFKTVYNDDTSVLNSFNTVMAICQLNKIAHACWREYSGRDDLSNVQLVERVNNFVNAKVNNIFDGRYVIQPDAQVTDADKNRGFSWTLPIKIYSPSMKTVMTTYVQAFRIEDLATA